MSNSIRSGLRAGFSLGIIIVFLALTGFLVTSSSMIGDLLGNTSGTANVNRIPVLNLAISLAIFGMIGGASAARPENSSTWKDALISGLAAGLVNGVIVGIFILILGNTNANGTDLRNYLPNVAPNTVEFLMFRNASGIMAALINAGILILSCVSGSLLTKELRDISLGSKITTGAANTRNSFLNIPAVKKFLSAPYAPIVGLAVGAFLLFLVPRLWGPYWNFIMGTVGIYIILGLGLNIVVGLSGQLLLGYVAFFAIGAYSFGLLTAPAPHNIMLTFWQALPLSIIAATLTGVLLGLPILSLRGDYLAIVTLGFGEIIRILIKSDMLESFTAGPRGIRNIAQPMLFGKPFSNDVDFMYLIIIGVLVGLFIAYRLQNSRTGRAWLAIREDETVAQATGIDNFKYKILALALGAAFAGLAGALFASRSQFTGPEDHIMMVSINVLCLVIVGGMGSIPGVVLGSLVLKGLPEMLRDLDLYRMLVFGALLVIMMIVRQEGLWPISRPNLEPPRPSPSEASANPEGEV